MEENNNAQDGAAPDPCFKVDTEGCFIETNAAFESLTGYAGAELRGRSFLEILHQGSTVKEQLAGFGLHFFYRSVSMANLIELTGRAGEPIPVMFRSRLVKDGQGRIVEAVGITRQLDSCPEPPPPGPQSRARELVYEMLSSLGDGVVVADGNGRITFVNEALYHMLDYRPAELIGKHFIEITPFEGSFVTATGKDVVLTRQYAETQAENARILFEKGKVTCETYFLRKDGKILPVEATLTIQKDSSGAGIGSITICRDISLRQQALEAFKQTRDSLSNIIESSPDSIVVSDGRGSITRANKSFLEMTGHAEADVLGKRPDEIFFMKKGSYETTAGGRVEIDDSFYNSAYQRTAQLFNTGVIKNWETFLLRQDGRLIPVEQNIVFLNDEAGNRIGAVANIRDITDRQEMENRLRQNEKLKSLGELAGGVAHDFNNLLATIVGRSQLLVRSVCPEPAGPGCREALALLRQGLTIIEKAALDGAETVRRIQEFANRKDDGHFLTVDINEMIQDALEFTKTKWKDEAESRQVRIDIRADLGEVPPVAGSPSELREVFTNLINNAVDAMSAGGELCIKTFCVDGRVAITVKDSGFGVPEGLRDRIFDPFFTTKGVKSSGLGLSVTYGIISRHHGTIKINSLVNTGTTFTIHLPAHQNPPAPPPEEKAAASATTKARILVVDDEREVLETLSDILQFEGHEVETATNGYQALELFMKKDFDVVFTDLGMPEMSGWELSREISKAGRPSRVVLVTGWNVDAETEKIRESGIAQVINKPFRMSEPLQAVNELLHGSEPAPTTSL